MNWDDFFPKYQEQKVTTKYTESVPATSVLSGITDDDWDEIGMERFEMLENNRQYGEKA